MRWLALLAALGAGVSVLVLDRSARRAHRLAFVPPALGVGDILYAAEAARGFGPGGNETGIILYAMPAAAQAAIDAGGTLWPDDLSGRGPGWQGVYRDWHRTPFDPALPGAFDIWSAEPGPDRCGHDAGIAAYMFRYNLCIDFDPEVEALANRALGAPGSYYAFGRIGLLLLIPREGRIIYAWNG